MKFIKKTIIFILSIILIIGAILVYQGHNMYKNAIETVDLEEKLRQIQAKENFTYIEDLPKEYINAVIATEDRRFYKHNGIDIIAIGRAIITDIKEMKFVEGGSTITQQVAKNIYFSQEKSAIRKIAEFFMAIQMEKVYDKDEIFELYVNTSYFGSGYYCIADATKGYFDKKPSEMDLYDSSLLAGIPNAPSIYDPTKNPDLAMQRQRQVLLKMVDNEYLSEEEAEAAMGVLYNDRYV